MPAEAKPNPLAPNMAKQMAQVKPHPMMMHAKMWQHANSIPKDDLDKKTDTSNYITPLLGQLSSDPDVTSKDVIKAAAGAAADGKIQPDEAVHFISSMPDDPKKLQPWLKGLYKAHLSALVHMKAAQMQQQQAAMAPPGAAAPQGPVPGGPAPMPGLSAPAAPGAPRAAAPAVPGLG